MMLKIYKKVYAKLETHFQAELVISSFLALFVLFVSFNALAVSVIKADGSSTVFPITEAVAEDFQDSKAGVIRVTVGISGTGGGFKKFCRGEIDVQNASRPIQKSELDICDKAGIKFFELPVAFDATVIVVNPKNKFINEISTADLKKIWEPSAQGTVMKWNQVNPKWPDSSIKLFGAGADSGTFDYFTEAIVGKAKSSRTDYNPSEDDNTLVTGVSRDVNALGYLPLAYYEENKDKLKAVGIIGGPNSPKKDKAVLPTSATVMDGSYFPLARPIFIYVNASSVKKAEVKEFVRYYLNNASTLVPQAKYIPLPKDTYTMILKHFDADKQGTMFGGHSEIGLKLEDLISREKKM